MLRCSVKERRKRMRRENEAKQNVGENRKEKEKERRQERRRGGRGSCREIQWKRKDQRWKPSSAVKEGSTPIQPERTAAPLFRLWGPGRDFREEVRSKRKSRRACFDRTQLYFSINLETTEKEEKRERSEQAEQRAAQKKERKRYWEREIGENEGGKRNKDTRCARRIKTNRMTGEKEGQKDDKDNAEQEQNLEEEGENSGPKVSKVQKLSLAASFRSKSFRQERTSIHQDEQWKSSKQKNASYEALDAIWIHNKECAISHKQVRWEGRQKSRNQANNETMKTWVAEVTMRRSTSRMMGEQQESEYFLLTVWCCSRRSPATSAPATRSSRGGTTTTTACSTRALRRCIFIFEWVFFRRRNTCMKKPRRIEIRKDINKELFLCKTPRSMWTYRIVNHRVPSSWNTSHEKDRVEPIPLHLKEKKKEEKQNRCVNSWEAFQKIVPYISYFVQPKHNSQHKMWECYRLPHKVKNKPLKSQFLTFWAFWLRAFKVSWHCRYASGPFFVYNSVQIEGSISASPRFIVSITLTHVWHGPERQFINRVKNVAKKSNLMLKSVQKLKSEQKEKIQ